MGVTYSDVVDGDVELDGLLHHAVQQVGVLEAGDLSVERVAQRVGVLGVQLLQLRLPLPLHYSNSAQHRTRDHGGDSTQTVYCTSTCTSICTSTYTVVFTFALFLCIGGFEFQHFEDAQTPLKHTHVTAPHVIVITAAQHGWLKLAAKQLLNSGLLDIVAACTHSPT